MLGPGWPADFSRPFYSGSKPEAGPAALPQPEPGWEPCPGPRSEKLPTCTPLQALKAEENHSSQPLHPLTQPLGIQASGSPSSPET